MTAIVTASLPAQVMEYQPAPAQGEAARSLAKIEQDLRVRQHQLRPAPPPFDDLDPLIAYAVASRWKEPCEGAFEFLAGSHPEQLLRLIALGKLAPADLTFAAEIAGRLADSDAVRRTLVPLLDHQEAVVREGAIYGLTRHLDQGARERLSALAAKDPSAAVRTAAADALDEL